MKTIHINDKAKSAIERHAIGGCLLPGSFLAVAEDTWEITLPNGLYERIQRISRNLRGNGLSATFSDVLLTMCRDYETRTNDESP